MPTRRPKAGEKQAGAGVRSGSRAGIPSDPAGSEADFAKKLVHYCFRQDETLESAHRGLPVQSKTGDFSDVKVVTPFGEIPWNDTSRVSQEEMATMMRACVERAYRFLLYKEVTSKFIGPVRWDDPSVPRRVDEAMREIIGKNKKYLKSIDRLGLSEMSAMAIIFETGRKAKAAGKKSDKARSRVER